MTTLYAVPKPQRSERLMARAAKKLAERFPKLNRQRRERIENYGRRRDDPEGMTGPEFKRFILTRDKGRCVIAGCTTPYLGCTAHHIRHVGAGGKNDPENGATLCVNHHDAEDRGELSRQEIRDRLIDLGHIARLSPEDADEIQAELERKVGRVPTDSELDQEPPIRVD